MASLLGKQAWPREVIRRLVAGPLGQEKSSAGDEKPRTVSYSVYNLNSHFLYGTGNPSQTTNIKMDLEPSKTPDFPTETNAEPLCRSIFTASDSKNSREKNNPPKKSQ